jgi:hypothetical protein
LCFVSDLGVYGSYAPTVTRSCRCLCAFFVRRFVQQLKSVDFGTMVQWGEITLTNFFAS